ncbi:MAG: hypothetical protein LBD14_01880, partial [Puniceicoccales bacterium]|nr:hypothetical protein [Puniceicoccales bacterium]
MTAFVPNATASPDAFGFTQDAESSDPDRTLSWLRRERGASNHGVQVPFGSRPALLTEPPAVGGIARSATLTARAPRGGGGGGGPPGGGGRG